MEITHDIQSLSVFKRDTAKIMRQMRKTGRPVVLTVNGKASLVVHEAAAYDRYVREKDRLDAIAGIRRGLADFEAGRFTESEEFFKEFQARHGISDE